MDRNDSLIWVACCGTMIIVTYILASAATFIGWGKVSP